MRHFWQRPLLLCLSLILIGCAGYTLGGEKPTPLREINVLFIPLAKNNTLFPRADALLTNTITDAIIQDGSYRLGTSNRSDATLRVTLESITYNQARSSRSDTIRSEELTMRVNLRWSVVDPLKAGDPLMEGEADGSTRFFAGGNLQTARNSSLPDALQRASEELVSQLSGGF